MSTLTMFLKTFPALFLLLGLCSATGDVSQDREPLGIIQDPSTSSSLERFLIMLREHDGEGIRHLVGIDKFGTKELLTAHPCLISYAATFYSPKMANYLASFQRLDFFPSSALRRAKDVWQSLTGGSLPISMSPLHCAVEHSDEDLAALLLSQDSQRLLSFSLNQAGETPIHVAARKGNQDMLKVLVREGGMGPNIPDKFGRTALLVSFMRHDLDAARALIHAGASADQGHQHLAPINHLMNELYPHPSRTNRPPLDQNIQPLPLPEGKDIRQWAQEALRFLLTLGADPDKKDRFGLGGIIHAAQANDLDVVKVFLHHHANINLQSPSGDTALHYAVWRGNEELVETLLQSGASTDLPNNSGDLPLHYAVRRGRADIVKMILHRGGRINVPNKLEQYPLLSAAAAGNTKIVQLLLDHGAKISQEDDQHRNALLLALIEGHQDLAKMLIRQGATLTKFHKTYWKIDTMLDEELQDLIGEIKIRSNL